MSKKQKRMLFRVLASAVLFAVALLLPTEGWLRLFTFLIPYAVIAWDVLWRAVRNIAHGQVFDENFLMSLATVGALATGEYPEAVFVMLFYQVGELFQSYAVDQSRKSITSLMDIRPDYANIEVDGQLRQVDPEDVAVGDTIVIKAGERIPLDGVVLEGTSNVDTAALTGESLPREAQPGDDVISGCVNLSGLLRVRVTKPLRSPLWLKFWIWWRTPPARRPRQKTSSPSSPGTTPPPWCWPQWLWPSCPPCLPPSNGWTPSSGL